MTLLSLLATLTALGAISPGQQSTPPPPPPPVMLGQARDDARAAIQADLVVMRGRIGAMSDELAAANEAAGNDRAKAGADMDAIIARYQPVIDAFLVRFESYYNDWESPGQTPEHARAVLERFQDIGAKLKAAVLATPSEPANGSLAAHSS